jgi:hypothetical protein
MNRALHGGFAILKPAHHSPTRFVEAPRATFHMEEYMGSASSRCFSSIVVLRFLLDEVAVPATMENMREL